MSRKNPSMIEAIFWMAIELPWWVGLTTAIIMYLVAILVFPHCGKNGSFNFSPFLVVAGKIIALVCAAGAVVSGIRSLSRKNLLDSQGGVESIRQIDWQEFEMLVGEAYRRQGYFIEETGGGGADGGVDLVLFKNNKKTFVQCKQWRERQVGVKVVRELYGVMTAEDAAHGIVISSGSFTNEALDFARGKNLTLVDGDALWQLVKDVKKSGGTESGKKPITQVSAAPASTPSCPFCGKAMVLRTAKKGANAGSQFWGCPSYPACKGTRQEKEMN